jgi:hypothetical protein
MNEKGTSTARMTRQSSLKTTALLPLTALAPTELNTLTQENAKPSAPGQSRVLMAGNAQFQVSFAAGTGLMLDVLHVPSGIALAHGNYSYSFGQPAFGEVSSEGEGAPR